MHITYTQPPKHLKSSLDMLHCCWEGKLLLYSFFIAVEQDRTFSGTKQHVYYYLTSVWRSRDSVATFCAQDLTGLKSKCLLGSVWGPSSSLIVGRIRCLAVEGLRSPFLCCLSAKGHTQQLQMSRLLTMWPLHLEANSGISNSSHASNPDFLFCEQLENTLRFADGYLLW